MGVLACSKPKDSTESPALIPPDLSSQIPPAAPSYAPAHSSLRCAECHGPIAKDWNESAHARAANSPLYLAMRQSAGQKTRESCDRCHTPLHSLVEPLSPLILEGVSCEVCHSISDIREEAFGVQASYSLNENIKMGFRCGAKDNYFHKVGCSPQFKQSILCAPCHSWAMPRESGEALWIFSDYNEWKSSTFNSISCQDCHMPTLVDEVAVGWEKKAQVGHHGMMGEDLGLRTQAIRLRGRVEAQGLKLSIALDIKNTGAGHKVPGGLPGRQMVLRIILLDKAGAEVQRRERIYERRLVSAKGEEVPFFQAEREDKDTRLSPGEARPELFEFDYKEQGSFRIALLWRSIAPKIGDEIHITPEERTLFGISVPFGAHAPGRARREMLPKAIAVKP